jgi:hypothetical protein
MFPPPSFNPFMTDDEDTRIRQALAVRKAQMLYGDLKRKSWWRQKFAHLKGQSRHLKDLSQVRQNNFLANYHPIGIQSVRIDCIVGSENRANDFDDNFLPVKNHNSERWAKIAELMLLNVNLPAVDLIKVNGTYFVRDGHHRVSVARYFGQRHIDANVLEMVVAPPELEIQLAKAEEVMTMEAQACPA